MLTNDQITKLTKLANKQVDSEHTTFNKLAKYCHCGYEYAKDILRESDQLITRNDIEHLANLYNRNTKCSLYSIYENCNTNKLLFRILHTENSPFVYLYNSATNKTNIEHL